MSEPIYKINLNGESYPITINHSSTDFPGKVSCEIPEYSSVSGSPHSPKGGFSFSCGNGINAGSNVAFGSTGSANSLTYAVSGLKFGANLATTHTDNGMVEAVIIGEYPSGQATADPDNSDLYNYGFKHGIAVIDAPPSKSGIYMVEIDGNGIGSKITGPSTASTTSLNSVLSSVGNDNENSAGLYRPWYLGNIESRYGADAMGLIFTTNKSVPSIIIDNTTTPSVYDYLEISSATSFNSGHDHYSSSSGRSDRMLFKVPNATYASHYGISDAPCTSFPMFRQEAFIGEDSAFYHSDHYVESVFTPIGLGFEYNQNNTSHYSRFDSSSSNPLAATLNDMQLSMNLDWDIDYNYYKCYVNGTDELHLRCGSADLRIESPDHQYNYNGFGSLSFGNTLYISDKNYDSIFRVSTYSSYFGINAGDASAYADPGYSPAVVIAGKYFVDGESLDGGDTSFVVASGNSRTSRRNALRVASSHVMTQNAVISNGAAGVAEYYEWVDGNPNDEDRIGRFVTLDGEMIRIATPEDDYILGALDPAPFALGDEHLNWKGKYKTDVFGRVQFGSILVPAELDDKGNIIVEEHYEQADLYSDDYDPTKPYVRRGERVEFDAITSKGKVVMIDDGTCVVNGYATVGKDGVATKSDTNVAVRVLKRIDDTHIRVYIDRAFSTKEYK